MNAEFREDPNKWDLSDLSHIFSINDEECVQERSSPTLLTGLTPAEHLVQSLACHCTNWKQFNRQTLFVKPMEFGVYYIKQNVSNAKCQTTMCHLTMEYNHINVLSTDCRSKQIAPPQEQDFIFHLKELRESLAMDDRDGPLNSELINALNCHRCFIFKRCRFSRYDCLPGDRRIMLWRWFADSRDYLLEPLVSIVAEFLGDD